VCRSWLASSPGFQVTANVSDAVKMAATTSDAISQLVGTPARMSRTSRWRAGHAAAANKSSPATLLTYCKRLALEMAA
jgi:hypothetical protein